MLPFFGECSVAYIPNEKVVGLSKIPRMIEVFARRLQIQERMTEEIAEAIMKTVKPKGVAVVSTARHMCMEMRGVEKYSSITTTSALRGVFHEQKTRDEFFSIINSPMNNRL
jgi:GTP cyclohydrolase I